MAIQKKSGHSLPVYSIYQFTGNEKIGKIFYVIFKYGLFITLGKIITFTEALVTQLAFTYSKSAMENPGQCMKSVQS